MSEPHCATCACGRRANVQSDQGADYRSRRGAGTISCAEHELAWSAYEAAYHGQSAQRIHDRGGFGYSELVLLLGREPTTWRAKP